jgi:3-oxoacyl-[acyl-carrier protein] reductase
MTNAVTKSALITGASGGIGRPVAKRLAQDGFAVVVNYSGNSVKADKLVNEIKAAGGKAIGVKSGCRGQ